MGQALGEAPEVEQWTTQTLSLLSRSLWSNREKKTIKQAITVTGWISQGSPEKQNHRDISKETYYMEMAPMIMEA